MPGGLRREFSRTAGWVSGPGLTHPYRPQEGIYRISYVSFISPLPGLQPKYGTTDRPLILNHQHALGRNTLKMAFHRIDANKQLRRNFLIATIRVPQQPNILFPRR